MKASICLNMIVKNEAPIVTRCLDSVVDHIDYWVICDTGSTDGTQDIIKDYFKAHNIDGVLLEEEWVNFEHNRNIALQGALGNTSEYILLMDADDYLEADDGFEFTDLTHDAYRVRIQRGNIKYNFTNLLKSDLPWVWHGVIHAYLHADGVGEMPQYNDVLIHSTSDGNRGHSKSKYLNNAKLLEDALIKDPTNTRYQFYLAESYRDAGEKEKALENYEKRIAMGGNWYEEIYISMLNVARCHHNISGDTSFIIDKYIEAHQYRPTRLESLYEAVCLCRSLGLNSLGYALGRPWVGSPMPDDILFVSHGVYGWQLMDEVSLCAFYAGASQDAGELFKQLLLSPTTPKDQLGRIQKNLSYVK